MSSARTARRSSSPIQTSRPSSRNCSSGTRPARYSLTELTRKARAGRSGVSQERRADPGQHGSQHSPQPYLRRRFRLGRAASFEGRHEPLVRRELWEQVQAVLDGRHAKQAPQRQARLRFLRPHPLRPLRLRAGRRNQEAALRLLPLHRLQGADARSPTRARRSWSRSSPTSSAGSASTRRCLARCPMRSTRVTRTRSASRRSRRAADGCAQTPASAAHARRKLEGRGVWGPTAVFRRVAGGTATVPSGDRPGTRDCEPLLHGGRRGAARTGPGCTPTLREPGTAREATTAREFYWSRTALGRTVR